MFEDLLDKPHNKPLMKLLYRTAEWHALAKSRMHTNTMLEHLHCLTKEFGSLMWQFRDQTCSQFDTVDLPREVAAQNRNRQHGHAKVSRKGLTDDGPEGPMSALTHQVNQTPNAASSPEGNTMQVPSSCKLRMINLFTTKFHFLGDYVQAIQRFGCTDSFSTQLVRLLFLCWQTKH